MAPFHRILITGAAGRLGSRLRTGLAHLADHVRLTDRVDLGKAGPKEELVVAELGDRDAVLEMTKDVDAIVHFGGAPLETDFETILDSTIRGSYHIYEGARQGGAKRVVYASSIHAVGYHLVEDVIDTRAPHRPDSFYGLSKCYAEDLARLYFDKFGLESVCLRICSSFDEPIDRRMMWTMLTYEDCIHLVERSLLAPRVGFTLAFGTSDNHEMAVSNRYATHLGFRPKGNTEAFREKIYTSTPHPDPHSNSVKYVGGWFCDLGHPDDAKKS